MASFVLDIVWTYCVQAVSSNKIWIGSITSGLLVILSSFTTIEYIENHNMIFFAAGGAFLGTFCTMKYTAHKE